MSNSSEKIKLSFNPMYDFLMELRGYKSSEDEINTFSIIGDRGYGKSTVLQHIYDSFSEFRNENDSRKSLCKNCGLAYRVECKDDSCIKNNRYITLQIINPDHLKNTDIMSWIIGAFENIVKEMKKNWTDMPICQKNTCYTNMQEFLKKDNISRKIDINEHRKFFLEEWYDELITDCYKRSNEYRESVLKQFKENFEYKEKYKKILSSDRKFKDNYDDFVRCLMVAYQRIKGLSKTPKLLILIDDLDIHPKHAYDILIDTSIMLNNKDTVIVIAGNLEGFTQSVKATLYDEYMSDVQMGLVTNNSREFDVRKQYLDQLSRNTINKALPISKRYFLNGLDNISEFIPISKDSSSDSNDYNSSKVEFDPNNASKIEDNKDTNNLGWLIKKSIAIENDDTILNLFHNSPRKLSSLYEILDYINKIDPLSSDKNVRIDAPKCFNNMAKLLRYDTSMIDDSILNIVASSLKFVNTSDNHDKTKIIKDYSTIFDSIRNYYASLRDNFSDSDSNHRILVSFTDILILYICWIYFICPNEEFGIIEPEKQVFELIKIISEIMNTNVLSRRSVLPTTININKDKEAFKLYVKIYISNTILAIENRATNFFKDDEYSYVGLKKSQLFYDLIFLKSRKASAEESKVDKILDLSRYNIRNISIVDEINECLKLDESEIIEAVNKLNHEIIGLNNKGYMFNVLVELKSRYIKEKCKDAVSLLDDKGIYKSSIIKYEDFIYTRYLVLEQMKSKILQTISELNEIEIINESKAYEIELIVNECDRLTNRLIEIINGLIDFNEVESDYDIYKIPDVFKEVFSSPNIETSREYDFSSFKENITKYLKQFKEKITATTIIKSTNDLLKVVRLYCENLDELIALISDLHIRLEDKLDIGIKRDIYDSVTIYGLEEAVREVSGFIDQTMDIKKRFEITINPSYHDKIQDLKEYIFEFIDKCCAYQDINSKIMDRLSKRHINKIDRYCTTNTIKNILNSFTDSIVSSEVLSDILNSIYGQVLIDVLKNREDSIKLGELLSSSKSNLNDIINFTNKYLAILIIDELNLKSVIRKKPNFTVIDVDLDLVDELNKVKYSVSSMLSDVNSIMDNLINYTDQLYADRIRFVMKLYLSGLNIEENISVINSSRYAEMVDRIKTSIEKPKNYDLASIGRLESIPYDLDFSNNTENDIANGMKFFDVTIKLISEAIKNSNLDVQDKNVKVKSNEDSQENDLESDGIKEQNIEESTS